LFVWSEAPFFIFFFIFWLFYGVKLFGERLVSSGKIFDASVVGWVVISWLVAAFLGARSARIQDRDRFSVLLAGGVFGPIGVLLLEVSGMVGKKSSQPGIAIGYGAKTLFLSGLLGGWVIFYLLQHRESADALTTIQLIWIASGLVSAAFSLPYSSGLGGIVAGLFGPLGLLITIAYGILIAAPHGGTIPKNSKLSESIGLIGATFLFLLTLPFPVVGLSVVLALLLLVFNRKHHFYQRLLARHPNNRAAVSSFSTALLIICSFFSWRIYGNAGATATDDWLKNIAALIVFLALAATVYAAWTKNRVLRAVGATVLATCGGLFTAEIYFSERFGEHMRLAFHTAPWDLSVVWLPAAALLLLGLVLAKDRSTANDDRSKASHACLLSGIVLMGVWGALFLFSLLLNDALVSWYSQTGLPWIESFGSSLDRGRLIVFAILAIPLVALVAMVVPPHVWTTGFNLAQRVRRSAALLLAGPLFWTLPQLETAVSTRHWGDMLYWLLLSFGIVLIIVGVSAKKKSGLIWGTGLVLFAGAVFLGHWIVASLFGPLAPAGGFEKLLGLALLLAYGLLFHGNHAQQEGVGARGSIVLMLGCTIFAVTSVLAWMGGEPTAGETALGVVAIAAVILMFSPRHRIGSMALSLWAPLFLGTLIFNEVSGDPCQDSLHASSDGYLIARNNIPLRILAQSPDARLYRNSALSESGGYMTPFLPYFVFARNADAWRIGEYPDAGERERYWVNRNESYCWGTRAAISVEEPVAIYASREEAEQGRDPLESSFLYRYADHFNRGDGTAPAVLPLLQQEGDYWSFVDPRNTAAEEYPTRWIRRPSDDGAVAVRHWLDRWSYETLVADTHALLHAWRYRQQERKEPPPVYDPCGIQTPPIASEEQNERLRARYLQLLEISGDDARWDESDTAYIAADAGVCAAE